MLGTIFWHCYFTVPMSGLECPFGAWKRVADVINGIIYPLGPASLQVWGYVGGIVGS